jgi:hypothetical protein
MGIFDKLGKAINRPRKTAVKDADAPAPAPKKTKLTPKEQATKDGEPWFTVIDVEIDADNPRNGSFELDWNEHFPVMLRKHGLVGDTDEEVVDQWFQDLCKQIALETYDDEVFGSNVITETLTEDGKREYK